SYLHLENPAILLPFGTNDFPKAHRESVSVDTCSLSARFLSLRSADPEVVPRACHPGHSRYPARVLFQQIQCTSRFARVQTLAADRGGVGALRESCHHRQSPVA